jgi:hypothetical protein
MFLPNQAQVALVDGLCKLGLPSDVARKYASYPDHMPQLDQALATLVERIAVRSLRLKELYGCEAFESQSAYLEVDLTVFSAYLDEVTARGMSQEAFHQTNRAIRDSGAMMVRGLQ